MGIGTTTPSNLLHVVRSTDGVVARFTDSNGNCDIDPTSTALICSSDSRLKKNVVAIDNTLQNLMALNPVTFNWSKEDNNTPAHIGFIAQEVEPLFPNLVSTDDRGMKAVAYGNFVPLIVKGIQEQQLLLNGKDGELLDGLSTSTRIINTIKNEDERNAIDAILARVDSGVSVLTDFIATRVTAVRGYFDEVFAKKVQTEELCVSDESGAKTCLNKSQIDTLLNSQVAKPPTQNNVAPVETESIKDDVTSETLSTNPPIIEELVEELPGQDPIEPTVETPVIETEVSEEVVVETPVVETIAEESVVVQ